MVRHVSTRPLTKELGSLHVPCNIGAAASVASAASAERSREGLDAGLSVPGLGVVASVMKRKGFGSEPARKVIQTDPTTGLRLFFSGPLLILCNSHVYGPNLEPSMPH